MRGLNGRGPGQLKNRSEWEVWAFGVQETVCGTSCNPSPCRLMQIKANPKGKLTLTASQNPANQQVSLTCDGLQLL